MALFFSAASQRFHLIISIREKPYRTCILQVVSFPD